MILLHVAVLRCSLCIRESVDSLCRDGTDTPIVCVHTKAFETHEHSRSKRFWALSCSISMFFYRTISPKWLKRIARLTVRKRLNHRIVHLSSLRDFFKRPTSKLAIVITVAFARISFKLVSTVPFTTKTFLHLLFDSVEA